MSVYGIDGNNRGKVKVKSSEEIEELLNDLRMLIKNSQGEIQEANLQIMDINSNIMEIQNQLNDITVATNGIRQQVSSAQTNLIALTDRVTALEKK